MRHCAVDTSPKHNINVTLGLKYPSFSILQQNYLKAIVDVQLSSDVTVQV